MRDKHAQHYQMLGARSDVRIVKRVPVSIAVPPHVLAVIEKARKNGDKVIVRSM